MTAPRARRLPNDSPGDESCRDCKGAGFVRLPLELAPGDPVKRLIPCHCQGRRYAAATQERLLSESGLSASILERFTFARFDATGYPMLDQLRREVESFADAPDGWMTIFGSYGTGKTHLAIAAAGRMIDAGHPVFYGVVPQLLDDLRAAFSRDGEDGFDARWRRLQQAKVLILDDLGSQRSTDWTNERLFNLLDRRYLDEQPTLVTSNLTPDQIGGRLGSRLQDSQLVTRVELRVPDYRQRGATAGAQ